MVTRRQKLLLFGTPQEAYLLRDDFSDTLAALNVNGTLAVPGPGGARAVTDTNGKLSLSSGALSFATGSVVNDGVWYPLIVRTPGRILLASILPSDANCGVVAFGWSSANSGIIDERIILHASNVLQMSGTSGAGITVGAYATTNYKVAAILRAAGVIWFIKGGAFTNWVFLGIIGALGTNAYPGIATKLTTLVCTSDFIRVPVTIWLPTPLASDDMSSATLTDGLGHAEGVTGGIGAGGANVPWATAATWAVAGGVATNTPVVAGEKFANPGAEGVYAAGVAPNWSKSGADGTWSEENVIIHGNAAAQKFVGGITNDVGVFPNAIALVAGNWYKFSGWIYNIGPGLMGLRRNTATGLSLMSIQCVANSTWTNYIMTARMGANPTDTIPARQIGIVAQTFYCDDFSLMPFTTAELFRSLTTATTPDVVAQVKVVAMTNIDTQAGLVIRLNDPTTPMAGIIAYFTGNGSVTVDEFSGAVYTQLFTATKAFTASDSLQLIADGVNVRLFHMTSAGVATLIGSTAVATITTGGYHGLFSTDVGNTLDNLCIYPRGTGGEFNILNRWST